MARKTHVGKYSVGDDERTFESDGPAISLALTKATSAKHDCAFYVRELGTQGIVAVAERVGSDVIVRRTKRR